MTIVFASDWYVSVLFWCSSLKSAAVLMWCDQCDLLWAAPQQSSAGRNTLRSGPDNHMLSGLRVVWVSPVKQISWHVTQPSEGEEGETNSVMRCVSFTAFYSGHHGEETSFVQCRNLFSPLNALYRDLQIYASSGNGSVKHKKMFSRIVTPILLCLLCKCYTKWATKQTNLTHESGVLNIITQNIRIQYDKQLESSTVRTRA